MIGKFFHRATQKLVHDALGATTVNYDIEPSEEVAPEISRGTILRHGHATYTPPSVTSASNHFPVIMTLTPEYLQMTATKGDESVFVLCCDIHSVQAESERKLSFRIPGTILQTSAGDLDKHTISLHSESKGDLKKWVHYLQMVTRSGWSKKVSFAPIRRNINARFFVQGEEYFQSVADYIDSATIEILIADWWLSPTIYLKRNPMDIRYRLDNLLSFKAKEGVQIHVLIFAPPVPAVALNPEGVKAYLENLSPNIHVEYSPKGEGVMYTHHQKFVVIDRTLAFVGGIDLCIGRYNESGSRLDDEQVEDLINSKYQGYDYYNPSVASPDNKALQEELDHSRCEVRCLVDRKKHPRMPWQDAQVCVDGDAARDVAYNFIHRWNAQVKRDGNFDKLMYPDFVSSELDVVIHVANAKNLANTDLVGLSDPYVVVNVKEGNQPLSERRGHNRTKVINDNLNPVWNQNFYYQKTSANSSLEITFMVWDKDPGPTDDFLGRYKLVIDKSWGLLGKEQTVQLLEEKSDKIGQGTLTFSVTVQRTVTDHESPFRWEHRSPEGTWSPYDDETQLILEEAWKSKAHEVKLVHGVFAKDGYTVFFKGFGQMVQNNDRTGNNRIVRRYPPFAFEGSKVSCQVLRSVDHWSTAGLREASALEAYLQSIINAKYFIYIESQFFISDTATSAHSKNPVQNEIASTIVAKIKKAWEDKQPFKVIVVVPLHPEGSPTVDTIQAVMHWQYRTINRDGKKARSMFSRLNEQCPGINIEDYITFFSLYNHGKIISKSKKPRIVSSQIYVHSKILIVDDEIMIVGSQNINDRSLLGSRDSELAVMIFDDKEKVEVEFSGQPATVNKIVQQFRMRLWTEHLKITDQSLMVDPTTCYHELWLQRAKKNTAIYDEVFPGKPQDTHFVLHHYSPLVKPNKVELLEELVGNHILFPLNFFKNVSLRHIISDLMFQ